MPKVWMYFIEIGFLVKIKYDFYKRHFDVTSIKLPGYGKKTFSDCFITLKFAFLKPFLGNLACVISPSP
jgi:hypothetical protein